MRILKNAFSKRLVLVIALILAVQVIGLCCVSAVYATSSSSSTPDTAQPADESLLVDSCIEIIDSSIYKASRSCGEWLYELMEAAGIDCGVSRNDRSGIFREAVTHRILDSDTAGDPEAPVTRRFAAMTMVKALGYRQRSVGYISDINSSETYMQTAAYYGYFVPDIDYCVYPDAELTDDEWAGLREDLMRYRELKGKHILSFGDSIMYGSGNSGEGISDMIAEKYGMTCTDYAVPGATMGVTDGRGHIPDQLRLANKNKEKADLILINGGTNDMVRTKLGEERNSRSIDKASENDFTGGFEKCMWMLGKYWEDVPAVYIRVHDMDLGTQVNEAAYGNRAMKLADKWGIASVDLFSDTAMNTEDAFMCDRYTYYRSDKALCDSIHPTALGYAKYYLPLIGDAVWQQMKTEVKP